MQCRKCKQTFDSGGEAHVIPKGLGGKYTPTTVFCAACDNSLSDLDRALVEQYDIVRFLLGLSGWREVPKLQFTDLDGDPVVADGQWRIGRPGPRWKKTLRTDSGEHHDVLIVPLSQVDQMRPWIEKQPGGKKAMENMAVGTELPIVSWRQEMGGPKPVRAAAKMLYTLACDHLGRKGIGADFSEIEDLIFDGGPRFPLCAHEVRSQFYRELGDFTNMLVLHFDASRHTVVGFATVLGSMMYSALLTRRYSGAVSHSITMRNNPLDSSAADRFETLAACPDIEPQQLIDRSYLPKSGDKPDLVRPCWDRLVYKARRAQAGEMIRLTWQYCLEESGFDPNAPTPQTEAAFRTCWAREYKRRFMSGRPFMVEEKDENTPNA